MLDDAGFKDSGEIVASSSLDEYILSGTYCNRSPKVFLLE